MNPEMVFRLKQWRRAQRAQEIERYCFGPLPMAVAVRGDGCVRTIHDDGSSSGWWPTIRSCFEAHGISWRDLVAAEGTLMSAASW